MQKLKKKGYHHDTIKEQIDKAMVQERTLLLNRRIIILIIQECCKQLSMSSRWSKNNVGPRIDPCGTPLKTGNAFDK